MRKSSRFSNLTFLVWNVGGLTIDKLEDRKFRKLLKYDVICLTETHTTIKSKINIPSSIEHGGMSTVFYMVEQFDSMGV